MKDIIFLIFSTILSTIIIIYMSKSLLEIRENIKGIKKLSIVAVFIFLLLLNYYYVTEWLRLINTLILVVLVLKFLYNKRLKNIIIAAVVSYLTIIMSEIIFVILLDLAVSDLSVEVLKSYGGKVVTNISIYLISYIIFKTSLPHKLCSNLIKTADNITKINQVFLIIFLILTINLLLVIIYNRANIKELMTVNTVLIAIYTFIVYRFADTEAKFANVSNKYTMTLKSLREYEEILDKYRINNHENRNQLMIIRNMIVKGEKNVKKYIENLLDVNIQDDERLMYQTSKIPDGGLRGLIYSKVLYMQQNKINYELNISPSLKAVELIELGEKNIIDMCKIVGVFLDNAIEEVSKLKNGKISISMYIVDDTLSIEISNNFEGNFDIRRISDPGYTTKGKGHGYGLSLVRKIINENKYMTNLKRIDKDVFTQILNIKIK